MQYLLVPVSTTHVDRYGTCIAHSALVGAAEKINREYIPFQRDHMPPPIGVCLYAEIHSLANQEYALCVVVGIFEPGDMKERYKISRKNGESSNALHPAFMKHNLPELLQDINSRPKPQFKYPTKIEEQLEQYLNRTQIREDGQIYEIRAFIEAIGDLRIEIFSRDHLDNPPHFHIISRQRGINARFHAHSLEYINTKHGKLRTKDHKKIKHFFKTHPEAHKKLLERLNEFQHP